MRKQAGIPLWQPLKDGKGKTILFSYGNFTKKDIAVLFLLFDVEYSRVTEIKD